MSPQETNIESSPKLRPDAPSGGLSECRRRLTGAAQLGPAELADLLRAEQCYRWQQGDRVTAESYFEKYSALEQAAEHAVDLVYSEFILREELGEHPRRDEYLQRFPQFAQQLQRQFALHQEFAAPTHSSLGELSRSVVGSSIAGRLPAAEVGGWPTGPAAKLCKIGRFEIKQQLGVGGFGSVFLAYDPQLGRDVALKVPHMHLMRAEHRDRFLREARAAAQLQHPNLVAVYDSGATPEGCYIAYQLICGQTLAQRLKQRNFDPTETAQLVRKLAQAAHHAHTKGVFHRDLKTTNVLIDEQGEPYISDFGLVRLEGDATLTADATVLGTPAYMSPEQARGASHQADARSDVYTLGVVLYELLAGRVPFDGPPQSVLRQVIDDEPPHPRTVNRRVPKELVTICLKAMAKRPADRYASAQHLADDLARWLRHEPIQARRSSTTARIIKWSRRRPATAGLVAVILLAASAVVVVGTVYNIRLRASNLRTEQWLAQTRELLSQAQAQRGVQLLETNDSVGLLHLLEARKTAEGITRVRESRSLLWAGWFDACVGRLLHVVGDESHVDAVAFCPDAAAPGLLATASAHGIRLWDVETGELRSDLLPHSRHTPIAFSPDGKLFATAPSNDAPRLWDTSTGKPSKTQFPSLKSVGSLAFSPEGSLLAVSSGTEVWLGDLSTGKYFDSGAAGLRHEGEVGFPIAFTRDGKMLATVSRSRESGIARIWRIHPETQSAELVGRRIVHDRQIVSVAFSPDGARLATAARDETARLWDTTSGEPLTGPMRHRDAVWAVTFSKEGSLLATASFDGTARIWDPSTGKPLSLPLKHQGPVRTVDFSPDGKLLATGSFDGTIRLWSTASGQPHGWPMRHPGDVSCVTFSPDGGHLSSASSAGSARIWNVVAEHPETPKVFRHASRVYCMALSPKDGKLMVTGSGEGTARIWDTATGNLIGEPWHNQGEVFSVAFSSSGGLVAIGWASHAKSIVELRDTSTGDLVGTPLRIRNTLRALAFSPDEKLLATGTSGGTVQLWETSTGQRRGPAFHHQVSATDSQITAVAFSPDGELLATASADKTVQLWNLKTRQHHCQILWHEGSVEALAFSPNGKRLATASRDLTVRFWDTATGKALARTIRPQVSVQALAFSPDGKILATASADGAARLWDLETGLSCGLPLAHEALATAVAFDPYGRWLATASFDKTARLWRLPQHLGDSDLKMMQLRTWVALGTQIDSQGNEEAILWKDWQRMQKDLHDREGE